MFQFNIFLIFYGLTKKMFVVIMDDPLKPSPRVLN